MSSGVRVPLDKARALADRLVEGIRPFCERVEIAGSIRRERPAVGDIEVVALPKRQMDLFGAPQIKDDTALGSFLRSKVNLVKDGPLYKQFEYGGLKVDLWLPASRDHWGSVLLIRTGSRDFNRWLMTDVQRSARVQFRDGLIYDDARNAIPVREESDVFAVLGLPWIAPVARDDDLWLAISRSGWQRPPSWSDYRRRILEPLGWRPIDGLAVWEHSETGKQWRPFDPSGSSGAQEWTKFALKGSAPCR